jgi:hypothetical protein
VDGHARQQPKAHNPQQRPELAQKIRVAVDVIRMLENLQVADQMPHDEKHENKARRGHQKFPADGRIEQSAEKGHREEIWGNKRE